jgi:hypothetical protein
VPAKARTPLRSIPDLKEWAFDHQALDHQAGTNGAAGVIPPVITVGVATASAGNDTMVKLEEFVDVEVRSRTPPARHRNEFHIVKFTNHDDLSYELKV